MDDKQSLGALTVYNDLIVVLQERGMTDAEIAEIFAKLTAEVEMEVVEELLKKLSPEQLKQLDDMPDTISAEEIATQLNIDGDEVDAIRAEKTAILIQDLVPSLNQED